MSKSSVLGMLFVSRHKWISGKRSHI